jgi:hypothetical protein
VCTPHAFDLFGILFAPNPSWPPLTLLKIYRRHQECGEIIFRLFGGRGMGSTEI